MSQGAPQKIFVWDKQGNYLDCAFPNPLYGHFLGGQGLKGKNVRDVLDPQATSQLLEAMHRTMKSGKPVQINLALVASPSAYKTVVCLFPFSEHIMGWINDYPLAEDVPKLLRSTTAARRHTNANPLIACSAREREVCALLCEGKANAEIACQIHVSERTVRFHLENLFRKCQVSSRVQLAHYASDLLQVKSISPIATKIGMPQ